MADNSSRTFRSGDPYARSATDSGSRARAPAPDPLAELARLIGQNDPFADLGHDSRYNGRHDNQPAGEPDYDGKQPAYGDWASNGYADPDPHATEPPIADRDDSTPYRDHDEPPAFLSRPRTAPNFNDARYEAASEGSHYHDERSPLDGRSASSFVPESDSEQVYDSRHESHEDHETHRDHAEHHERDAADPDYQHEEFYDDAPRRRKRGGLVVVMAVLGLAVVGTAGAFAYRAMFGGAILPSLPPIIKASITPNKVVPPSQGADGAKAGDRVATAGQSEKLVSREEQPVDMKEPPKSAPRVISTIPVAPAPPAAAPAPPPPAAAPPVAVAAPPAAATPAPPPPTAAAPAGAAATPAANAAEPKKIRTVTIRPDQVGATASAAVPPLPVSRGIATRSVTPPKANTAPESNESGPLALVPTAEQGGSASPARLPRARSAALGRPSGASPAPAAGGGYAVQVSSQHSEAEAHSAFKSLQSRFPNQLGGREVMVRRADLGSKGIYYRAMVGPFASMEEAAGMCSSLKAAGGNCLIQKN